MNKEKKRKFIIDILINMRKDEYKFSFNKLIKKAQKKINLYFSKRKKLINIIKDVHIFLNFNKDTFYSAVYYLDIICNKLIESEDINFENYDFKSLAISCLILSSKFTDNDPNIPNIKLYLYEKNSNNSNIKTSDIFKIKEFEIDSLIRLCYKLNYSNLFSYLKVFYCNGFIFNNDIEFFKRISKFNDSNKINNQENDINNKFYSYIEFAYKKCDQLIYLIVNDENFLCNNYDKIDQEYSKNSNIDQEDAFDCFKIICGLIYFCREFLYKKINDEFSFDEENKNYYEIWGKNLQSLYNINFIEFEKEYTLIKRYLNNNS